MEKPEKQQDNLENSDPNLKKRKAEEMDTDENDDEELHCNICFEPWSNTGSHRITSLKCGHFFGFSCIEKWLNSTGGNDCPTCNEKATKRDIRPHYVHKLIAIDTADRDRALEQVDKLKKELRTLELEMATLKVANLTLKEENFKLKNSLGGATAAAVGGPSSQSSSSSTQEMRLTYVKRLEMMRLDPQDPNKYCRVLAYNDLYGMLVVSQPSQFNALAPGFGVRRVQMLDKKLERFVSLHKEVIRDVSFNPINKDLLLSVSQDKTIRLTNVSSCAEIQRYHCETEIWSCCWHSQDPHIFYIGTKRSHVYIYDTRTGSTEPRAQIEFPVTERRPIIGLIHVPKDDSHRNFPVSGLLVMTLGSLWFFEDTANVEQHTIHKLSVEGLFWSFDFHAATRNLLINFRPQPHARHMVLELNKVNVSQDVTQPQYSIRTNIIFDQKKGGSYKDRSFLRSILCSKPRVEDQLLVIFGRGSSSRDHKLVVQELGSERVVQEISIEKPILNLESVRLNDEHYLCILSENEVHIYKWQL